MEEEAEQEKRTAVIYPVEGSVKYDEDGNQKKPCTKRQKALRDIAKAMKKEHAAREDLENAETKAAKRAAKRLLRQARRQKKAAFKKLRACGNKPDNSEVFDSISESPKLKKESKSLDLDIDSDDETTTTSAAAQKVKK